MKQSPKKYSPSEKPRHRVAIPGSIVHGIQILNKNRCCFCQAERIQIHHIDRNPRNNSFKNLAALCLLCHNSAEEAKSPAGLTRPLTSSVIRKAKALYEAANAKSLGFESPEAFWKVVTNHSGVTSRAKPKYFAYAFRSIEEWEKQKKTLAAYMGENKPYFFQKTFMHDKIWVIARAGIPGQSLQLIKPTEICEKNGHLVKFVDANDRNTFALGTYDLLPIEKQVDADNQTKEQLQRVHILETIGVYADFKVNGIPVWPDGIIELELATWLQCVAVLQSYLNLLGENAKLYLEVLAEWKRCKAMNLAVEKWGVSYSDGILADKIDKLISIIKGKGISLKPYFEELVTQTLKISHVEMLEKVVNKFGTESHIWDKLVEIIKTAIFAITSPENASAAFNNVNSLLYAKLIVSFHENIFSVKSHTVTSRIPNAERIMTPANKPDTCNLSLTFNDYFTINMKPDNRPDNPREYMNTLAQLTLSDVFKKFRKPIDGININDGEPQQ